MLLAGARPTRFDVREAANRPIVPVPAVDATVCVRSSSTPAVGDICCISVEGDSVTMARVSANGGPAAWMRVDGLNAVGISTRSDGIELPVVPTRSPARRRSYGRITPPATGTNTTLYGSMVVRV